MYLTRSVGKGANGQKKNEVFFVQELLGELALDDTRIPEIKADGLCGKKTISAIIAFQKHIVKLSQPDGRIDPNGRSEKTLISMVICIDKDIVPSLVKKHKLKKENAAKIGSGPRTVNFRTNAKKVLSPYTLNIVKLAMGYAGINRCDVSSTRRTFDDQARIMYDNCAEFPNAGSVKALRTARKWGYAAAGQSVEEIYYEKKSQGKTATRAAMKEKIVALYNVGTKVSLHCVSEGDYKKKNVLDIPYSSVAVHKRKDFERALMGMTQKTKNARYAQPTKGEIYIERMIIENRCWHLEIPQLNKALPNQKPPAAPVIRAKHRKPTRVVKVRDTWRLRDYFSFLDDWF